MKRIVQWIILAVTLGATLVPPIVQPARAVDQPSDCGEAALYCPAALTLAAVGGLQTFRAPTLQPPEPPRQTKTVTYDVTTKGAISANVAEFKRLANQTLNDGRGWAQLGVQFSEVASAGDFTLVLSEASQVPSFSDGCDATYSCNAGRYVIINQDRWLYATSSWNDAGGSLRDYRNMVVNHETGHWLGHPHATCPGPGQPAAVMQQQSINLGGCTFNPWPLKSELWSTRLGISNA